MINGKDSWKFLVFAIVVLVVTCGAGGIAATVEGWFPKFVGLLNGVLGITIVVKRYLQLKD